MGLNNFLARFVRINQGGGPVSLTDSADDVVTTPSASFRFAAGTGTLASGTVTIATGLASVIGFVASRNGTGATATGATEVEVLVVSTITTGSVVVNGSYHSGTAAVCVQSVSGTASFNWMAYGT